MPVGLRQLDTNRSHLGRGDCLHETGLQAHAPGIFLINDRCGSAIPGSVVLGYIRKQADGAKWSLGSYREFQLWLP